MMETASEQGEVQGGVTLKALLQNPFLLLPKEDHDDQIKDFISNDNGQKDDDKEEEKQKQKEKELELDYDQFGSVNPMSAFLGPKLWEDSMLYDDKELKFEFMDIDEFLNEQGILVSGSSSANATADKESEKNIIDAAIAAADNGTDTTAAAAVGLATVPDAQPVSPQEVIPMSIANKQATPTGTTESSVISSLATPPRTPSPVAVNVDFEVSHTDVALATIPGQDTYDPRSKQFTDEELKPQPMITKSKKVFVPDEQKDDKYWERRRKNNVAAKRSRNARRVKENQIVLRAAYLERENGVLKDEVVGLKKENMSLKSVVQKLEQQLKEAMQQ